jgi:hypothetical protein
MLIFNESQHTNIAAIQRNVQSRPGRTTSLQVWRQLTQLSLYPPGTTSSPSATSLLISFDPLADNQNYLHMPASLETSILTALL